MNDDTSYVVQGLVSGTLTVADTLVFLAPTDLEVVSCQLYVATAPTGAALTVNVKVELPTVPAFRGTDYGAVNPTVDLTPSGTKTSLYSAAASFTVSTKIPTAATALGAPTAVTTASGTAYSVAKGSLLYIAVTQIGSTVAGANLYYSLLLSKR